MPAARQFSADTLEVVDAFFALEAYRYDVQFVLDSMDTYRSEEVYIFSNSGSETIHLVHLPPRLSLLQLNMKARDATGENLVILSRDEEEKHFEEIFARAKIFFDKRQDVPFALQQLLKKPAGDFGSWAATVRQSPAKYAEIVSHLAAISNDFPEQLNDDQAAAHLLGERIVAHASLIPLYRPIVQLRRPVPPASKRDSVEAHRVVVKYVSDEHIIQPAWSKPLAALLGWWRATVLVPLSFECSTHFRLRPPNGTQIDRPLQLPGAFPKSALNRSQAQLYASTEQAKAALSRPENFKKGIFLGTRFQLRVNQTTSTRALVAILFAVLAFGPLLVEVGTKGAWAKDFGEALGNVTTESVIDTATAALPVAFGLIAVAWDKQGARAFAVVQLVVALCLVVCWLVAPLVPKYGYYAIWGGGSLALYNLVEGLWVIQRMPEARHFHAPRE